MTRPPIHAMIRIYGWIIALLTQPPIFTDLTTLADATRSRMLLLLDRNELTVSELCAVLQLPQSTVSRHLKTLLDAGWVTSRREATSRYYTLAHDDRDAAGQRLWTLLREQVGEHGRRRPGRAPAEERAGPPPIEVAGVLRIRGRAVGPAARRAVRCAPRICRRCPRCWTRRGSSAISGVAPGRSRRRLRRSSRASSPSIGRARCCRPPGGGCGSISNVRCGAASSRRLPIADEELDAATLMLVLHHVADPASRAARGGAGAEAGGTTADLRHAPARSRGVSPPDGARLAGIRHRTI